MHGLNGSAGTKGDPYSMWEQLNLGQYLGPVFMSFLTWVISRAKAKIDLFFDDIDARKKEIQELREDLGKQKMINDALWRNIDELKGNCLEKNSEK